MTELPRAMLIDMDDTILSAYGRPEIAWNNVTAEFAAEFGPLTPQQVANAVLDGLYKLLAECVVNPDHPLRLKVEEGLEKLADDLLHDPQMQGRVARMKAEILANPAVGAWMDGMWERMRAVMLRAARDPDNVLSGQLGASLAELGRALREEWEF